MKLPAIEGLIRRRLLVNYRADPQAVARLLPAGFRPKSLPAWAGIASENAAHRIAVTWEEDGREKEGVYIPRRDTGSLPNYLAGGRLFPGEHHLADFRIEEAHGRIAVRVDARDGSMSLQLDAAETGGFPESSCFASLAESSAFFEPGSAGYSATKDRGVLDGLRLETHRWEVRPLAVQAVRSSFFDDLSLFPAGSAVFDHALVMRDIPHAWHQVPSRRIAAAAV